MLTLGLVGGSGSGKGAVSRLFLEFNIPSIDTDGIYRDLTAPGGKCINPLAEAFGSKIIKEDGSLDRKALSAIVFCGADATQKREMLNKITHAIIIEEVKNILREYSRKYPAVLIDAPLLFESGLDADCNEIIAVVADKEIRIKRIVERDGISREKALERINAQLPDEYLIQKADYTITNNGTLESLYEQVSRVAEKILRKR